MKSKRKEGYYWVERSGIKFIVRWAVRKAYPKDDGHWEYNGVVITEGSFDKISTNPIPAPESII